MYLHILSKMKKTGKYSEPVNFVSGGFKDETEEEADEDAPQKSSEAE